MNPLSPFPNLGEIIRYLANAFDLKASKKKIDDYARHGDTDYRLRGQLIEEVFTRPLGKILNDTTTKTISAELNVVLSEYVQIVNTCSVECVTRENALSALYMDFIGPNMLSSLNTYLEPFWFNRFRLDKEQSNQHRSCSALV